MKDDVNRSVGSWDQTWEQAPEQTQAGFDAPTLENAIDRDKIRFLGPMLPDRGRAMEVGCGSARLLARVGQSVPLSLFAIDSSRQALRVAKQTSRMLGTAMTCVSAVGERLPFRDGSFDVVLSGGLLEHFPDPRPLMSEMVRVLRPGGVFYADVVPRKFSFYRVREVWRMLRSEWMLPGVYESTYGPGYYVGVLKELGCTAVTSRSCGVYPPVVAARVRNLTGFLDGTVLADWFGWYFLLRGQKL